ncbi:FecR family protein [Catalinimonas niigatensis]|uniref:FecR family protein n=1 Tax=Catalinimonas niigatensis TaxID=1397264 RepID=UPI002665CA27|nr:FecR domain-containing protein [Catalinimonas niigatensis]WPP50774.1 FecR domain-containing protein [Catalinimonas niigatensis]
MNESQFRQLLDRYLKGECTSEEISLLHHFYDSFQGETVVEALDPVDMWLWEEKNSRLIAQRMDYMERRAYDEQSSKRSKLRSLLKTVASLLLIIGLGIGSYVAYLNMPAPEIVWLEKTTQRGQKATITLTDGTRVYMNVDSKLSFPEHFAPDKREVILEGEAFFDVAKNPKRPFIIRSGELTTTVLGTSFNVKAFKDEPLNVTVVSGRVKVNSHGQNDTSDTVTLEPHQQAFYDGVLSKRKVDISQFIAWKEKVIHLEEVSLAEAVVVLERWFNVSITLENEEISACKISGKYINENLINIMKSFEHILGIEYRIDGERKITITGKGCKSQN